MAAGEARHNWEALQLPSVVQSPFGVPQWNATFEGIPYILRKAPEKGPCAVVVSSSGNRPYVKKKHPTHWEFVPYAPRPAGIVIHPVEQVFAKPFAGMVMVEPNVKANGHHNKDWGFHNWQRLVNSMPPSLRFVQCAPTPGSRWLQGVTRVLTPSFRHAMAVLAASRAFVGTEGGLMHAAAGLDVPGVIIWSEFISPMVTGYSALTNLRAVPAEHWCGRRFECVRCRRAMNAISCELVARNLLEILDEHEARPGVVVPWARDAFAGVDAAPEEPAGLERPGCIPGEEASQGDGVGGA